MAAEPRRLRAGARARPEVTARILLKGKEGTVGLMPPLGTTLTDEQIASVLTYIRREWGQDGAPVEPALGQTGPRPRRPGRTKPWTNDELLRADAAGQRSGRASVVAQMPPGQASVSTASAQPWYRELTGRTGSS